MRKIISSLVLFLIVFTSNGQNVGIGTATPHPSAALDISSSTSGFLPPRMTNAERNGINNPAAGLMIYNTSTDCLEIFGKGKWNPVYCVPADNTGGNDSTIVTDIDGNTYPTVKICDQTWMAKNLDVARYRNGDPIPKVTEPTQWANLTTGAWCWYNNDSATYGSVYGRLYNWYAVNDPRGLSPQGWHIPSDGEWNQLVKCIDENADTSCQDCAQSQISGGALKESGTTHWSSPNTNATNSSNFTGLPAGNRYYNGPFLNIGLASYWWATTESNNTLTKLRSLSYNNASISKSSYNLTQGGFSVRCVKDTPITSLNNGLVAYYPFSGNAGDSSGNGNHGTVNGATLTSDRFGNTGKAYSFNGIDNYISANRNQLSDFSFSLWFNSSSSPEYNPLIDAFDSNCEILLRYSSPDYVSFIGLNNYQEFISTQTTTNNVWYHIVCVFSTNTVKFYLNGTLTDQYTVNPIIYSNGNYFFGASFTGADQFYDGKLDDIRIYNRVLTQAEITYLATH